LNSTTSPREPRRWQKLDAILSKVKLFPCSEICSLSNVFTSCFPAVPTGQTMLGAAGSGCRSSCLRQDLKPLLQGFGDLECKSVEFYVNRFVEFCWLCECICWLLCALHSKGRGAGAAKTDRSERRQSALMTCISKSPKEDRWTLHFWRWCRHYWWWRLGHCCCQVEHGG
jgi:hypothetical protein